MRKSLLTLGLATLALSSFGATRILYQQNFETATTVEETGWTFGESITIASDAYGKFLELSLGGQNGRSAMVNWGQEIFLDSAGASVLDNGTYTVQYDFSYAKGSTNQYNGCQTIFTNHAPVNNQPYRNPWSPAGYWQNYLYDMSQVASESLGFVIDGGTIETVGEDGTVSYAIDYADSKTIEEGNWYTVTVDVNVNDRTVDYSVIDLSGNELQSGTRTVPETDVNGDPISMYAEGIFLMLARYQTIIDIDNVKVSFESEKDYANPPTVSLIRVGQTADEELDLNLRAYSVEFLDGETLHIIGTDGKELDPIDFADCEGKATYETTVSGTMKAWTTSGTATSEVVETVIECVPCVLPEAVATISAVSEGYGKTYTLSVNNNDVPMRPTIFINYEFTGTDGTVLSENGVATGYKLTVPGEGTLKLTTDAWGYQATTCTVANDIEFKTKKVWDFAHLTHDEISAALPGATWNVLNSNSASGFNSWTGRQQLFYYIEGTGQENEEGVMVYEKYLPFGFVSEDNTEQVLNYCLLDRSAIPETTEGEYFEGLTIFPERGKVDEGGLPNVGIIEHIGLFNDQTKNNNNNVYINDLAKTDFVTINAMANYGRDGNSNKPVCSTTEEYYALLRGGTDVVISVAESGTLNEETGLYKVVYSLYRVDTALMNITVYEQVGVDPDAVETINAVAGDGYWYSIDGVRVAEPTTPGLYIHNGKKYIVK